MRDSSILQMFYSLHVFGVAAGKVLNLWKGYNRQTKSYKLAAQYVPCRLFLRAAQ